MGRILTLALKDFRILLRDKFGLFWILVFPLGYAVFFGTIFGGGDGDGGRGSLSIAVVDEDDSEVSRRLLEALDENEAVRLERDGEGPEAPVLRRDLASAEELVRMGKRTAYLRIPAGYGDSPYAMFSGDEDLPTLEVGLDPARGAERGILQGVLMEATFSGLSERFRDKDALKTDIGFAAAEVEAAEDLGPAQKLVIGRFLGAVTTFLDGVDLDVLEAGPGGGMEAPFELTEVSRERGAEPRSAFEITFAQAIVWGLMSVALGGAIGLVRERGRGTLLRLRIAPLTRAELLAGKAVGAYLTCLVTMVVLVSFAYVVLGVRFDSPGLLVLAALCTAACFTGIMMTVSVLGKTEEAVAGATWGLMMPFAMIGGGMIPLIAMPEWLVTASDFSPFKWAILAFEGATWRGFDLGDMVRPCGVLLGIGAGFFALGVTIFRRIDS